MPERGRHRRLPSSPRSTTFIPALCLSNAKDHLLPDFYSGATGISGRFSEGLLLRRLQLFRCARVIDTALASKRANGPSMAGIDPKRAFPVGPRTDAKRQGTKSLRSGPLRG